MAKKFDWKILSIEEIEHWCVQNNEVEWLKAECAKTTIQTRYPRIKVWDESKGKYVSKADKTQKPIKTETPITFVEVKRDFMAKFFPDAIVGDKKKASFHDRIKNL